MEPVMPYLYAGLFMAVLVGWFWRTNYWFGSSPAARSMRRPLPMAFSATAMSALFLVSGASGWRLSKQARFVAGTGWSESVIWWQVGVGLALLVLAVFLFRRGVRDMDRHLGRA
jgi:hypothetical protein